MDALTQARCICKEASRTATAFQHTANALAVPTFISAHSSLRNEGLTLPLNMLEGG